MDLPKTGTMGISSPANGDTLGLQFSVYGNCGAVTLTNNPAMTVTIYDTSTNPPTPIASASTVNNQAAGTWEATFSLPVGISINGTGKIEVSCPNMTCTPVTGLTIGTSTVLTIAEPWGGEVFPAGTSVNGSGTLASGDKLRVYLTQAGNRLPVKATFSSLPNNGFIETFGMLTPGSNYVLHAHVLDDDNNTLVRMSSGFFSVSS
jgi:hypothetical protein